MAPLGADLLRIRENKNISLQQVSRETRISLRYLKSIEEGRFADLPGGMYNRAFIRAYCSCLGIDPREFMHRYECETSPDTDKPSKPQRSTITSFDPPRPHPVLLWAVGLLISVGALYVSRGWIYAVFGPYFSRPTPAEISIDFTAEPATAMQRAGDTAVAPAMTALSADHPDRPIAVPASDSEADLPEGSLRLTLEAVDDCWVSIDSDGDRVLVKLMKPGEDHVYAANEKFFLVIGNAGGVNLKVNGMPLKPLGASGSVVKLVITEQNLDKYVQKSTG